MPTLSPRSSWSTVWSSLYAVCYPQPDGHSSLLVPLRPLAGIVLPVAMSIAYVLSTTKVVPPFPLVLRVTTPWSSLVASLGTQ